MMRLLVLEVIALLVTVNINYSIQQSSSDDALCPAITSPGVIVSYYYGGKLVQSTGPQPIRTQARLSCKPGYITNDQISYSHLCQEGGKWNHPIFECTPGCGLRGRSDGTPLKRSVRESRVSEFPWHIAVYETRNGPPTYICGGTLISATVVISAAHCFYDEERGQTREASLYKVTAGKHRHQWSLQDSGEQKRNVSLLKLYSAYRGRSMNYASDIAIVKMEQPFEVTAEVGFICVDWTNSLTHQQLAPGIIGTVVSWRVTQSAGTNGTRQYLDMPYVTIATCLEDLEPHSRPLVTPDKLCAGVKNSSASLCPGDGGSGLVFQGPQSRTYFLQGISSVAFVPPSYSETCYSHWYGGFTSLSHFITWVQENM